MGEMFLDDGDVRLYHGDVLEVLAGMPDESVDSVVTSPPYWGLRDYGTGLWDGGDPGCDHEAEARAVNAGTHGGALGHTGALPGSAGQAIRNSTGRPKDMCGKCGARRVDQQLGLEPTPDLFVANMVAVFREVRRVLAAHGTCWVNLGDSYAGNNGTGATQRNSPSYQARMQNPGMHGSFNYTKTDDEQQTSGQRKNPPGYRPKDLIGIPWRVAFALQADGWYLRADIIWAKPNPMPESVTDRPTKSHEYVFLLTKQPRYYFDQEAVREAHSPDGRKDTTVVGGNGSIQHRDGERWPNSGRNVRSVWQIATQPYPEAHFATYPEELVRRCVLAGSPLFVCTACNTPVVHEQEADVTESEPVQEDVRRMRGTLRGSESDSLQPSVLEQGDRPQAAEATETLRALREDVLPQGPGQVLHDQVLTRVGRKDRIEEASNWEAGVELEGREDTRGRLCEGVPERQGIRVGTSVGDGAEVEPPLATDGVCSSQEWDQGRQSAGEPRTDDTEPASGNGGMPSLRRELRDSVSPCCGALMRPGVVLDPFAGSGTTCKVARDHGRHSIGIDLSADYLALAARRLQQLSLLT